MRIFLITLVLVFLLLFIPSNNLWGDTITPPTSKTTNTSEAKKTILLPGEKTEAQPNYENEQERIERLQKAEILATPAPTPVPKPKRSEFGKWLDELSESSVNSDNKLGVSKSKTTMQVASWWAIKNPINATFVPDLSYAVSYIMSFNGTTLAEQEWGSQRCV